MSTQENMNIKINLQSDSFKKGMADVNRQMKVAKSEFAKTSSSLKDFGSVTDKLKNKTNFLSTTIDLQKTKTDALRQAYEKAKAEKGEDAKETQNLATKYNYAQVQLNKLESDLKKTNITLSTQESKIHKVTTKLKSVGSTMQNVGGKMASFGKNMTMKVTTPIVGAGVAITGLSNKFKEGMAKVSTISDETQVPIGELREEIVKLSDDTGESVNSLAEAEYQAISAGIQTADSVQFVADATKVAKAGFTDSTTAVDGLSSVLNAYGLKASETGRISDEMFMAIKDGKTSFGELASSMGGVLPIASNLNVGTGELFASVATLTTQGIATSEAMTGLKASFSNILKPSEQAIAMAAQLGISFSEAHLKNVGFPKFMDEIAQATGGNTEQLAQLFGSTEAVNTVLALTSENGGAKFREVLGDMANSAGSTDEAFKKMDETTGNKLHKSFNKLKNSGLEFGDAIAPVVEMVSDKVGKLADFFGNLDDKQRKTIVTIAGVTAVAMPLIGVLGTVISTVGTLITVCTTLAPVIAGISLPVLGVVAGITALVAIGVALFKNWDTIKEKAGELGDFLGTKFTEIKDNTIGKITDMKDSVVGKFNDIKSNASEKFNNIKDTISTSWSNVKNDTHEKWLLIKDTVKQNGGGIKGIISTALQGYASVWRTGFDVLDNATGNKLTAIKNKISDALDAIKSWFKNLFKDVEIKIPEIKLPHFSITGGFSLKPPSVPSFGVDWFADGGIMTQPTMFGLNGNRAMVGGEAGAEAILPISKLSSILADTMRDLGYAKNNLNNSNNSSNGNEMRELASAIVNAINNLSRQQTRKPSQNHYHINRLELPNVRNSTGVKDLINALNQLPRLAVQKSGVY